ncbi:MAG: TonB-dependent receptor, partial [Candidatus Aminicenantes bacterium]|nr:TonB-dependent receptor [Candidatus Aminicenantes bacterium]
MRIRKQVSGIGPIPPIAVAAVLFGLLLPATVAAQTMNSDVTGVVTDATGGVIPGVTVIATNESNRAQRSAVTDDLGVYRLAGIQPGTYTVEAELTGFKRSVQTGIVVSPGLLRRVEIVLDVGDVTDSVIVTDAVPVLQTSNATISTALPSQVRDKPIASMTRGALLGEQMIWAAGSAAGGVYGFVGNRADMNQYNVEGMQYNFISSSVSNNIIEEVSVVLSNAPAEYARPVTLNATLKSGTNEYHAEYWMAGVNPCLNALRSPFSPARASRAPCVTAKRQFFNVGGPILKDRVFFFYSWARPNSFANLSNSKPQSFPSLRMQGGDFSLYPSKIIDPTTGEQFPGNIIPAGRISPVAQAIMNDFMGSSVNYLGAPESYTNNVQQLAGRYRQDNDHNIKTDFNVGENDSFSFHAVRHKVLSNMDRHHPVAGPTDALHTTLQDNVFNWQSGVTHSHVFGPGVINQMRLGVTRFVYIHRQLKDWEGDAESAQGPEFVNRWGLQGVAVPDLSGMPQVNIGGWLRTYFDNESATYDSRYSFFNDLSVTEGRHNIKIGMSAVKLLEDGPARGNYFGAFNFSNIFTGAQVVADPMTCAAPAVCGDAFADFLLGLPSSTTRYQPRSVIARRKWEWGAFIQDDWNVTDKLNLSYGLRWSRYTVPYDKNGMFYNFDPESLSIVVRDEFARERIHPSWPTHTFPVILASEAGFPSKLIEGSNNWQPRVGFAYRITPGSVLRGGWGIYNGASRFLPLQAFGPFVVSESFTNEVRPGSATGALYSWPHAFPTASDIITVSSAFGF